MTAPKTCFTRAALLFASLCLASPIWAQAGARVEAAANEPGPAGDGPYLLPDGKAWSAKSVGADLQARASSVRRSGRIRVGAVGDVPAFDVPLRAAVTRPAPDVLPLKSSTKLLVLADTHGEYEILVAFLRANNIVDRKLNWAFGKGQMVVTGDMFDRGAHQLEILWLLYKLEAEAKRAGGALHVLLGNHESMILRGDLRYLHPRYPEVARILGAPNYAQLFEPESLLGNWLRSRPAVLKLGDMLFLHGGVSPAIVDAKLSIADLNGGIRKALGVPVGEAKTLDPQTQLISGSSGPQWYRGYFGKGAEQTPEAEVDRSLAAFGVSRILVGHTIVEHVTPLYGGKVIAVQVYPSRAPDGSPVLEGALRNGCTWQRVTAKQDREAGDYATLLDGCASIP